MEGRRTPATMKFSIIVVFLGLLACSVAASDNCTLFDTCDDCVSASCHWIQCMSYEPSCQAPEASEGCEDIPCNNTTTTAPPTTTTTTEPTTTITTSEPTTITTEPPTTELPTTETPTTEPPTTTTPPIPTTTPALTTTTTEASTTQPPVEPTTTPAPTTTTSAPPNPPEHRHFDAASFFGGMVLAVALLAVAYAAFRFYRSRNERNYHTLQETVHM